MRLRWSLLVPLTLASTFACSLVVDPKQCTSDQDCAIKGLAFTGTICSAGVCLSPARDVGSPGDAGPKDECTSTADCSVDGGEHSVCLSGVPRRCVRLLSEDCTSVVGHSERDNPLLIGWLADTDDARSADALAGAMLALNDFQQALSGVPAAQGAPPRPLVLVVCAEQADALRAVRHLVGTLLVPAIVGPTSSERLRTVADVTVRSGTLLISPMASADSISMLKDENLVFHTAPSARIEGKAMGLAASRRGALGARAVAVATESERGRGLMLGLGPVLSLNGKTLADNEASGAYVPLSLPAAPDDKALEATARAVIAAEPSLVLLAGDGEQTALISQIEARWPGDTQAPARPTYFIAAGLVSGSLLQSLETASDAYLSRLHVVFPGNARSVVFQHFRRLFASSMAGAGQFFEAAKAYDSVYVLGLSVIPTPEARAGRALRGREMAEAIGEFLLRGDRVALGATSLPGAAALLGVRVAIDLDGASGRLDFDAQGDVETDMEIGCMLRGGDGKVSLVASNEYYRGRSRATAGELQGEPSLCHQGATVQADRHSAGLGASFNSFFARGF